MFMFCVFYRTALASPWHCSPLGRWSSSNRHALEVEVVLLQRPPFMKSSILTLNN